MNLQAKYLMQDQKKVGPNLKDVRAKLRKEWVPFWLEDPQGFRPGTKMPTFWRFSKPHEGARLNMRDKDGAEQIQAIAAYLWQESLDENSQHNSEAMPERASNCLKAAAAWRATRSARVTTS